ncbi:MAG: corrinoid protein [Candidatus Omnitrophota bacterium]|jgi:5-methyltetrahydrofolate--homocysteine methyltransferase
MDEVILKSIKDALAKGDRAGVSKLTKEALDKGIEVKTILEDGLIASMNIIGEKFKANEIFIPEVLIAAKAMHAGIAVLEPYFSACGIKPAGKVIIGTVKGDLHDIGKNIVSMMLKGARFEIVDLGIDVPPGKFVEIVQAKGADIIAMSSLLTTSMGAMKDTIKLLKDAGVRDKVKIIVGGAPVTQNFADSIGADGYAKDAATAVDKAKELLKV